MQTEIYTKQSLGINGQISKAESQYLATIQGVLMQDTQIGQAVTFGKNDGELISNNITAVTFVGFVVRDGYLPSCDLPTETYKAGSNVTVITKGSLFIMANADAKQGDYVNVANDGTLSFTNSENAMNYVGWRVSTGGKSGEVIEITTQLP